MRTQEINFDYAEVIPEAAMVIDQEQENSDSILSNHLVGSNENKANLKGAILHKEQKACFSKSKNSYAEKNGTKMLKLRSKVKRHNKI